MAIFLFAKAYMASAVYHVKVLGQGRDLIGVTNTLVKRELA